MKDKKLQRKTRVLTLAVTLAMMGLCGCASKEDRASVKGKDDTAFAVIKDGEALLTKSAGGNPIVGDSGNGEYIYGGDPSVMVDGDTVYLYTGHDMSSDDEVANAIYRIPEYLCYSTKDMENWKAEGSVMSIDTESVTWAKDSASAWASQVTKHYDKKAGKDRYYLYFCTWDTTSYGKQSIGVAVADSPTGPFLDKGEPLVQGIITEPESNVWNDIDPTVWVDKDADGEEHRYLAWGNSKFYICELNEDMMSVKDLNGDGEITCGDSSETADILNNQTGLNYFTEAPWLYRRQDENGEYYGDYYLFYAYNWRERMAYATSDDPVNGTWDFGKILMMPTATSNTNHMAVFDFKGKTYFVYHNGSLPGGNGYRRSACITELKFNKDGSVQPVLETAAGLHGIVSTISLKEGEKLSHENFLNASSDEEYPYKGIKVGIGTSAKKADEEWVLVDGKADRTNPAYVSIQAENKPGLYLTVDEDGMVTLAQDADALKTTAEKQTFHSVVGLSSSDGVSFESVSQPGLYLTVQNNVLCLTDGKEKEIATFFISNK